MDSERFDVVVIGSGPGGEGAAVHAAKNDRKVAVVEQFGDIGGSCTHLGTIPSKALRFVIFELLTVNNNKLFQEAGVTLNFTFPQLRKTAGSVIRSQVDLRKGFYERNRISLFKGHARFADPETVEIEESDSVRRRLTASGFVICSGSRPYRPPDVDFTHARIFDSDTILDLQYTPETITIYGAGVVGCEYASMFRNLGCKVNLINTRDRLLEFLDDEIVDALSYHMRDRGVRIRHREEYTKVEELENGVLVHLKSGKVIKSDVLLWANGRTGNSDNLGLESLGITSDRRGYIPVDDNYRTAVPNIYAAGDVIGIPSLASAAYVQGRYAASHLLGEPADRSLIRDIPTGIYTSPEISSVGKTERQLTEEHVPYEVGHAQFRALARAQITGQTVGILKILFHRNTLELLGVHCFGHNAAEIVHIGQAILFQPPPNNSLLYFINTTFNYPTMAEAYRVAALNGYNRLF